MDDNNKNKNKNEPPTAKNPNNPNNLKSSSKNNPLSKDKNRNNTNGIIIYSTSASDNDDDDDDISNEENNSQSNKNAKTNNNPHENNTSQENSQSNDTSQENSQFNDISISDSDSNIEIIPKNVKKKGNLSRRNAKRNKQIDECVSKIENMLDKMVPLFETMVKQQQQLINKRLNRNNDKEENDDIDIDINHINNNDEDENDNKSNTSNSIILLQNNHEIGNNLSDDNDINNELLEFIHNIKNIICIDIMDYVDEFTENHNIINDNTIDKNAIRAARKRNVYEIKNNVVTECNFTHNIPDQLLSQAITDGIYSTDTIADNNINHKNKSELQRDKAMSKVNDTIKDWDSKFVNPDKTAINTLLTHIMNPNDNENNMDKVNKINKLLADMFYIQPNGKIKLDLDNIYKLPASSIISINKDDMNYLYNDIAKVLTYDTTKDMLESDPNKRVKNGPKLLSTNIPRLNKSHINRIIQTIGECNNRFLLNPDNISEIIKFGILITISNKPNNHILHWKLYNTPFIQSILLQCLKDIIYKLNQNLNTNSQIKQISNFSQLSELASKICQNRYNTKRKDPFWVTIRPLWIFISTAIAKAKKTYNADGKLYRSLYRYANGKTIINRTDWHQQTFQFIGDLDKNVQKSLCTNANNLKRIYEKQISEDIICAQFENNINYMEISNHLLQILLN